MKQEREKIKEEGLKMSEDNERTEEYSELNLGMVFI
jgi:hypothetical protein